jgi:hypothetical protein
MEPLVNKDYLLEKFKGKGGWTFVCIPEIQQNKNSPFGMVRVKGSIDGVEIKKYNLMPRGNGHLFLPVKAEIRKKINKKEGDSVHLTLYHDNDSLEIPEELLLCLKDEPVAYDFFQKLSEDEQKLYISWIFAAKKEETKVKRIITTLERLTNGLKFNQNIGS